MVWMDVGSKGKQGVELGLGKVVPAGGARACDEGNAAGVGPGLTYMY